MTLPANVNTPSLSTEADLEIGAVQHPLRKHGEVRVAIKAEFRERGTGRALRGLGQSRQVAGGGVEAAQGRRGKHRPGHRVAGAVVRDVEH